MAKNNRNSKPSNNGRFEGKMFEENPPEQTVIVLKDEQKEEVVKLEQEVVALKCKLANLYLMQQQTAQQVAVAEKAMVDRINDLARTYGIDPDDTSKGRWNFDTKQMTFTKLA